MGKNCPRNDISLAIRVSSSTECAESCDEVPGCKAFAFDGTSCWLKHRCVPSDSATASVYFRTQGSFPSYVTFSLAVNHTMSLV